ncbi:J domain-containing protein [Synechocystis salina LEGE 06099]|uniref:J domain-containing protein n=1 Tax=Synechocystis salina TaxID=945780 RepID=UPI0018824EF7|nr:J domain-containing protein [Synechocystis salina]MBE9203669.1 J domain-containing protein [Synechocystis salina LEGE 06099]
MSLFPIKQGLFSYDVVDHHAILGCPLDATPQEIRKSYLKIAFQLHPDTSKAANEEEQALAAKLFSKFVNPAYEVLSRENDRKEHLLILQQTVSNLASMGQLSFSSTESQQLQGAKQNLELVYRKVVTPLSKGLYEDFKTVFPKIAQVSEYNLIFLMVKGENASARPVFQTSVSSKETVPPVPVVPGRSPQTPPSSVNNSPAEDLSPFEKSLRRAQEHFDRRQYDKAIAELKSALKTDPKNAQAHCLLGMAYLKNNMMTMAKVHIGSAVKLDPNDPKVMVAKKELAKHTSASSSQGGAKSSQGGLFGGLFGGKKK